MILYPDNLLHGGTAFDPSVVIAACWETGAHAVLLDEDTLTQSFFDLRTGVAGDLVQKLTLYGIRAAIVVPDPTRYRPSFQDFHREANRGSVIRFFTTREAAIAWLESC